jgi:hypothetical protein
VTVTYVYFSVATSASTGSFDLKGTVKPVVVIPRENSRHGDQGDREIFVTLSW